MCPGAVSNNDIVGAVARGVWTFRCHKSFGLSENRMDDVSNMQRISQVLNESEGMMDYHRVVVILVLLSVVVVVVVVAACRRQRREIT